MQLIFFADIYGLSTTKIDQYQRAFTEDIEFVSPYLGLSQPITSANYETFTQQVGIDNYTAIAKQALAKLAGQPFIAIGESVGATALWRNTPMLDPTHCLGAFCLYGSRIREFLSIKPSCNTQLWFSKDESYFVTKSVQNQLNNLDKVSCKTVPQAHGFATPGHEFFNHDEFKRLIAMIKQTSQQTLGD